MTTARRRHLLIAILTFLAGLYFILDYVVPPTLPVASRQGVVADTAPGSVTLETRAVYPLAEAEITVSERDTSGELKQVGRIPRKVRPGSVVNVRRGPYSFGSIEGRTLVTYEGQRIPLQPGEEIYETGKDQPIATLPLGMTVTLESREAHVASIDYGTITLIEDGRRVDLRLGSGTVVLRLDRFDPPAEVQVANLKVGDTVRVGKGTGFADNRDTAAKFNLIVATMAFGMGLLSLGSVHARNLRRRTPGWYASLFFFAAVVIGVLAGQYKYADPGTTERAFSDLIVLKILAAVGSAIFSLLAFYMASAAYRAFRVRTLEAGLMMASALVVMLGQTPFGTYLTSWLGESLRALWLPNVAAWILRVPTTAIFRGLIFGIMMGAIATALRYWLSAERSVAMGD